MPSKRQRDIYIYINKYSPEENHENVYFNFVLDFGRKYCPYLAEFSASYLPKRCKVTLTTIDIPEEQRQKKKALGLTWSGVVLRGISNVELSFKITALEDVIEELKERNAKLSALLKKYVDLANNAKDQ